ncbi:MAG: glutamyl-tRNA synthetase [Planctomycetota bacterium]|jgi:glutamyl-tRNA synthetase
MNQDSTNNVIVRYPPSPTGGLHVGNLRTLVFSYLFAKKHNGKIIYRSEDTDLARSKPEHEDYAKEAFAWLGMDYDEFYRQSERTEIYQKYLQDLIASGKAYVSEESHTAEDLTKAQELGKTLRQSVIRFKNPNITITFYDEVIGEVSVDTTELGDFVIAKDMEYPLYHLTVVVDDYEMGITHVIRGADHIANTPRQILIQEAIGAPRPIYAHVPLVVGADGKKLGKRHGATATLEYRESGYLSDAFLNFLAFIGWNPGTEQEIFTREDLIATFSLERIQKSPGVFNEEKLKWFNREHLKLQSPEELEDMILPLIGSLPGYTREIGTRIVPMILERIHTLTDIALLIEGGELQYYFQQPSIDMEKLVWKNSDLETARKHLTYILESLGGYGGVWEGEALKDFLWEYASEHGRGDVLWPLRFVLSGRDKSPDPFALLSSLGKEESLMRIQAVLSQ